jgi:hypothetical protein
MGELATIVAQEIIIDIGRMPVLLRSESPTFLEMIETRYSGFVNREGMPVFELDVELVEPGKITDEKDLAVNFESGRWLIERGDLRAEWEPTSRRGRVVQSANPYSLDAALRIIHSLILAREGGLLVHAASAVRSGKAFLFAGVSGAGKTTISRLAPADATLLTDEISYLQSKGRGYVAYGTPFAGELAKVGENAEASLAAVYFLEKGRENRIEPVCASEATRMLLANVLFFAHDAELVSRVFETACELVRRVPFHRLIFFPDERVWELIA